MFKRRGLHTDLSKTYIMRLPIGWVGNCQESNGTTNRRGTSMLDTISGILTFIQILLGSASIYSLLANAAEIGLVLMFALIVLISLKFFLENKKHDC